MRIGCITDLIDGFNCRIHRCIKTDGKIGSGNILIYGASLTLEFLALVVLRIREPQLKRPFRVPGGMFGAVAVGIAPVLLLGFDLVRSQSEQVWGMSSFALGAIVVGAGVGAYVLKQALKPAGWAQPEPAA